MNKLGALDANTDIYALLSLKSTASDLHAALLVWNLNSSPILGTVSLAPIKELKNGTSIHLTVLSWLGSVGLVHLTCNTLEEHMQHLRKVYEILRQNELYVRKEKCSFTKGKVSFLGHCIKDDKLIDR
ncbi:hypothetical protein CK203_093196 [Vitis vinifera]|uniref:Reverse transcriptase domain-containing protein n=1 Tax=Vitis vinifera TaxID=29760 RepID=A0A438CMQ3_VITVI|nr:hypothetical protein CK203_093196 [Vitis vinifera]